MRRLILGVFALALLAGHLATHPVYAASYAAGWNLVAGPEGSHLTGATGNIFTLQPGDTNYQTFPANSALHGGYGYWAYFPTGGSIAFAASAPSLTITPVPGQYMMLGNPSQSVATVTGADSVLTYTPSGGYQNSTVIPPGQGAWVIGSNQIALSAAVDSAPVAAAPVATTIANTSPPQTAAALKAVALNQSDLPGYTLDSEDTKTFSSSIASYFAGWAPNQSGSPVLALSNVLTTAVSTKVASDVVNATLSTQQNRSDSSNVRLLAPISVGDEEQAIFYTWRASSGRTYDDYVIYFRRGPVIVSIDETSAAGTGNAVSITRYAQVIDGRLTGSGSSVATAAAPVTVASTTGHVFSASGSGNNDTANFSLSYSAINVCAELSGRSPSGAYGADASFFLEKADGSSGLAYAEFTSSGCKLVHPSGVPGRFYLHVIATPWSNWSVTIDAANSEREPLLSISELSGMIVSLGHERLSGQ